MIRSDTVNDSMTTTVQGVLQNVIGLSPSLARRALREFEVEIDEQRCCAPDQAVTIHVGSTVRVGRTMVNVISAHLRTLAFYRDCDSPY